jgi:hypothetical protein
VGRSLRASLPPPPILPSLFIFNPENGCISNKWIPAFDSLALPFFSASFRCFLKKFSLYLEWGFFAVNARIEKPQGIGHFMGNLGVSSPHHMHRVTRELKDL